MSEAIQIHESVQAYYGAIARSSGASCCGDDCGCNTSLYAPELTADLPTDVTTIASLNVGETVLDLGSGGGIDCFLAAKQVGETGYVIGVDMTPDMLAKANANKVRMNAHNVEFRRGQIEQLPVLDNSVDVVMSNCVINLSPDKAAVFAEAFRVLKSGGRMAFSDIVTEGHFTEVQLSDMRTWAGCVSGAMDVNEFTGLITAAGFVDVLVVDKVGAEDVVAVRDDMPRIFSARITARKP
jgi:arsenite methyltransferase